MRARALLVTRNFPPLLGGMEKVNKYLLDACQLTREVALCGPKGCTVFTAPGTEVSESPIKPLPLFLMVTLWKALRLAWRRRPQYVIAGSGLAAPVAWLAARCVGAKAVVYLHGLDIVAPSRIYQWLWLPFIRSCDLAFVNSINTRNLAISRGVAAQRAHVLNPGTEMPVLDPVAASAFRQRYQLEHRPLLLSVGRLTQRKGLVEFVSQSLPTIAARYPDVLLLVIGEDAVDALHSRGGSERERISVAARHAGVERNICFFGRCDEPTLSAAYQTCDLHIFPVLDLPGDVEGFGMVSLEAAAHGLATVAFNVGGVPDAVEDSRTGNLVAAGDYAALADRVIDQLTQRKKASVIAACREFAAGKTWSVFSRRVNALLDTLNG